MQWLTTHFSACMTMVPSQSNYGFLFHTPFYVSSAAAGGWVPQRLQIQDLIQPRRRAQRGAWQGPHASKGCVANRLLHRDGQHAPPATGPPGGARARCARRATKRRASFTTSSCHRPPTSQPRMHRPCAPLATGSGHVAWCGMLAPCGGPQDSPICRCRHQRESRSQIREPLIMAELR
ncbi:unnamed protein product [Symbiodinium natans]|uniref:Uncharacterized protein n=1 Tax=Symbiodinium natans TaxID=878477 RepID=A0A812NY15_9DINO|nr:unnamed protein product [Symbiodinium natans]